MNQTPTHSTDPALEPAGSSRRSRYVTTAIPYVNAAPHIGFALEMIQADCLARLYRLQGNDVRFQAGTDENSLKNVLAAEKAGVSVETLVRRNADQFHRLGEALDLSVDDFIRTSSHRGHRSGVHKLWNTCAARGDIYKRFYSGLYCTGCEQFYKPADLHDGRCPEHGSPPEDISEENYFFRLSRYRERLREAVETRRMDIVPAGRRNEVLAWIEDGLEDFSISRSAERARGWGIAVPNDPSQVIYVWFDALGNYITALGYDTDSPDLARYWQEAATREHVIGKGITRFHALYWPAMLLSAGLALPTRLYVHGYITVDGRKIGKSAGNAIDPIALAGQRGVDALRYYLLRHIRSTEDGDFSQDRFCQAYESELAGQLGNLAHRSISMIGRYRGGTVPAPRHPDTDAADLLAAAGSLSRAVEAAIGEFRFQQALAEIWVLVAAANKYVTEAEPWSLARAADQKPEARGRLDTCLYALAHSLAVIGQCLAPLLPSTSDRLLRQLGLDESAIRFESPPEIVGASLAPGPVLFPKTDDLERPAGARGGDT